MKTTIETIESNKELMKGINKISYYSVESFIRDAERYISAIREGRVINSIGSVSSSGMSRTIKFVELQKSQDSNRYRMYNFYAFFKALGYTPVKDSDYFRVNGCGMDMIFHTNYSNIWKLHNLGFITREECDKLAQDTPPTI